MSLEGCPHGPTSMGFGPNCPQCAAEDMLTPDPETLPAAEVLRRLSAERDAANRKAREEREALVRLLDGFSRVRLDTFSFGGSGSVEFYECNKCAALVRPLAETQVRHKLGGCS